LATMLNLSISLGMREKATAMPLVAASEKGTPRPRIRVGARRPSGYMDVYVNR